MSLNPKTCTLNVRLSHFRLSPGAVVKPELPSLGSAVPVQVTGDFKRRLLCHEGLVKDSGFMNQGPAFMQAHRKIPWSMSFAVSGQGPPYLGLKG